MIHHLTAFWGHQASRATGLFFAAFGLLFGSWAAMIPYVKNKFDLDDAQLGLLLLCLPAGITITNPLTVGVLNRLGAARTTWLALPLGTALFILPMYLPNIWLVALCLVITGSVFTMVNVAINTCATLIEQRQGLRIMSTCHGLWSSGAMAGSAFAGMAIGWGMQPMLYMAVLAGFQLLYAQWLKPSLALVPDDAQSIVSNAEKKPRFIWPNKALWLLVAISLCTNITEGAMADWSAVYLRDVIRSPEAMVGWGFSVYALFMACGRFLGDGLIAGWGSRIVLRCGGIITATGLLIVVFFPSVGLVLLGFALVGAGVSIGAPILYAAAGRAPGMPKGAGLATMNTFAMIGFLGGPAFIGFIAKAFGLAIAFVLIAGFAGFWAWKAGKLE